MLRAREAKYCAATLSPRAWAFVDGQGVNPLQARGAPKSAQLALGHNRVSSGRKLSGGNHAKGGVRGGKGGAGCGRFTSCRTGLQHSGAAGCDGGAGGRGAALRAKRSANGETDAPLELEDLDVPKRCAQRQLHWAMRVGRPGVIDLNTLDGQRQPVAYNEVVKHTTASPAFSAGTCAKWACGRDDSSAKAAWVCRGAQNPRGAIEIGSEHKGAAPSLDVAGNFPQKSFGCGRTTFHQ